MFGNPQRKSDNWLFPLGFDGVGIEGFSEKAREQGD